MLTPIPAWIHILCSSYQPPLPQIFPVTFWKTDTPLWLIVPKNISNKAEIMHKKANHTSPWWQTTIYRFFVIDFKVTAILLEYTCLRNEIRSTRHRTMERKPGDCYLSPDTANNTSLLFTKIFLKQVPIQTIERNLSLLCHFLGQLQKKQDSGFRNAAASLPLQRKERCHK